MRLPTKTTVAAMLEQSRTILGIAGDQAVRFDGDPERAAEEHHIGTETLGLLVGVQAIRTDQALLSAAGIAQTNRIPFALILLLRRKGRAGEQPVSEALDDAADTLEQGLNAVAKDMDLLRPMGLVRLRHTGTLVLASDRDWYGRSVNFDAFRSRA